MRDMSNAFSLVAYGMLTAVLGAAYGWWVGRRSLRTEQTNEQSNEAQWTREVAACLNQLTVKMATSVGEHSTRLKEICDGLFSLEKCDPQSLAAALAKLVDANERLEHELASAKERLEDQARQIEAHAFEARTDALTRLSNRRAFDDELVRRFDEFQRQGRPFSLVMIDLDHFKQFNDRNGHPAGDEVLRGIAAVLRRSTRTMDLLARYGGEEFAVIMPGAVLEDAKSAAERIRGAIADAAFRYDGKSFQVTVSVGVAELQSGENASRLVRRADEALYAAKTAGRNVVWYHAGRVCLAVPGAGGDESPAATTSGSSAATSAAPKTVPRPTRPGPVASPARAEPDNLSFESSLRFADRPAFCQQVRCRLGEWKRGGQAFSVIFIEIDQFRRFCESHGQEAGEAVVHRFGDLLATATREMDLVARYSATTYAVLLPKTTLSEAATVAARIREQVAENGLAGPDLDWRFTVSVGLVCVEESDDVIRLLQRCEAAVTSARTSGANAVHVHNGQWAEALSEATLTTG